jgi:hypothetical protein
MARRFRPIRAVLSRAAAALWTARGRRALRRGDVPEAIRALERALSWRPGAFGPLLHLTRAYLRHREVYRAHRTLALARESDPARFERQAAGWLASEGVDVGSLARALGETGDVGDARVQRSASATAVRRESAALPYGDCRDLDEYAHFQAMPPISDGERENLDWDTLLADLLED